MAVTLVHDTALSRITIDAGTLGLSATYAIVDRTTDGVNFTTVRAATMIGVTAQALDNPASDYEFPDGVQITYRVRSFDGSDVLQDTQTDTITPTLASVWLKSIVRPFLNRTVTILDYSDIEFPGKSGSFGIVGRSFPVGVTDVSGSARYEITFDAGDLDEARHIRRLTASGDILFLHVPAGSDIRPDSLYFLVDSTTLRRVHPQARGTERRWVSIRLTEQAQPDANVTPTVGTWQSVVNAYADWSAVIADKTDWQEVLEIVGKPADVVVP